MYVSLCYDLLIGEKQSRVLLKLVCPLVTYETFFFTLFLFLWVEFMLFLLTFQFSMLSMLDSLSNLIIQGMTFSINHFIIPLEVFLVWLNISSRNISVALVFAALTNHSPYIWCPSLPVNKLLNNKGFCQVNSYL